MECPEMALKDFEENIKRAINVKSLVREPFILLLSKKLIKENKIPIGVHTIVHGQNCIVYEDKRYGVNLSGKTIVKVDKRVPIRCK